MQTNEWQNSLQKLAALEADWDGYGANPIKPAVLTDAFVLKCKLDIKYPHIDYQLFPLRRGGIGFLFENELEVSIYGEPDSYYDYFYAEAWIDDKLDVQLNGFDEVFDGIDSWLRQV